jgi:uncharacterized protein with ATP-grasp and redox domains
VDHHLQGTNHSSSSSSSSANVDVNLAMIKNTIDLAVGGSSPAVDQLQQQQQQQLQ